MAMSEDILLATTIKANTDKDNRRETEFETEVESYDGGRFDFDFGTDDYGF